MTPPARAPRKKVKTKKAPALSSRDTWGTAHEIEFLHGLGTGAFLGVQYRDGIVPVLAPRITLLRRYLRAMAHRTVWGDTDSVAVLRQLLAMLAHEKERENLLHATD